MVIDDSQYLSVLTFLGIVKYLPVIDKVSSFERLADGATVPKYLPGMKKISAFERLADGTTKQTSPLYWCVEAIEEVVDSPYAVPSPLRDWRLTGQRNEQIFVIFKNGPNSMAGIRVQGDEKSAKEYSRSYGSYYVKYDASDAEIAAAV
jgi:hypothetical protein